MTHDFDKAYWERQWQGDAAMAGNPPNPYLAREAGDLVPGTALDAGCGAGAEALWLAARGWQVTAVDISSEALAHAAERDPGERVRWVEADLGVWEPGAAFDLVTTHYAHPAMPQLDFYDRVAGWVAPGGTLLLVGHLQHGTGHSHGQGGHSHHEGGHSGHAGGHSHRESGHSRHEAEHSPAEASATASSVTARLDPSLWKVDTAEEAQRTLSGHGGAEVSLHDFVVRATRLGRAAH